MRFRTAVPLSLIAALGLFVPVGARAADSSTSAAPLVVSAANGPSAVRISGVAPAAQPLVALLYADFAPDLPPVFLSRRPLATDADGRFDAIVPIAPAFYPGAIVTVVVQTSAAVVVGRGSFIIADPTLPAPK